MLAWIVTGLLIGVAAWRQDRRPFPQVGSATTVGAGLGAFLGGGLLTEWSPPGLGADAVSVLASGLGALSLVAAVRWAGRSAHVR